MDPISITSLATLITQSATGEAGRDAWQGLVALVRRAIRKSEPANAAMEGTQAVEAESATDLARRLARRAATDPELAQALLTWMRQVEHVVSSGSVTNSIEERTHIRGPVIQARDIGRMQL